MTQHQNHSEQSEKPGSFWKSSGGIALLMVGLVVAFYLIREHWTHLGQTWPYLLLLLCPLMHLMHGGHGHGRHGAHRHSEQAHRPGNITRQDEDNA